MSFTDPLSVVVLIVMLSLLVMLHEYGHYLFARIFKMDIEEFAIGFGKKPILKWGSKKQVFADGTVGKDTVFTIRPWLLGGFVRVKGMQPEEDGSEIHVPNGFFSKSPLQRWMVLFAGPLFSIVGGVAVLAVMFAAMGEVIPSKKPQLGEILPESAAAKAGLKKGDLVVKLDGNPVATWYDMTSYVRVRPNQPIAVTYVRSGAESTLSIIPTPDKEPMPVMGPDFKPTGEKLLHGRIGAYPAEERSPVSIGVATERAVMLPVLMASSLAQSIAKPSRLKDEVGGPATIFMATRETVKRGLEDVIKLAGLLSISLGIMNLLPIYPLDGGQMTVAFVEMLRRGRRLSFKVQNMIAGVGLALIGLIFVGVLWVDVLRWFIPK